MMDEPARDWGGPYLQAAFFCERILQEVDGVLSAMRIVDRIYARAVVSSLDVAMPPVPLNLTLFVSFKSGQARGSHDVTIGMQPPSGFDRQQLAHSVFFETGEDQGSNIIVPLAMAADQEGLYWFDVLLNGRLITRVPLRVVFQKQTQGAVPPAP